MKSKTMRRGVAEPAALFGGALLAGSHAAACQGRAAHIDPTTDDRIAAGYAASPTGHYLAGKDAAQVGFGSYPHLFVGAHSGALRRFSLPGIQ